MATYNTSYTYPSNPTQVGFNKNNHDIESGLFNNSPFVPDEETIQIMRKNHKNFLRKVYCILLYQLVLTVGMCAIAMYNEKVRNYVITHNAPLIIGTIFSFVFLFMLFCYQKNHPINMILLTAFTISIGYTVAVVCGQFAEEGYQHLVIESFLITICTFVVLTIFTFQSKYNFDFLGDIVVGGISVLIFWGIICWIMGSDGGIGYSLLGIFIFVIAIIFDTHRLKEKYTYDEFIIAAVELYLDILNLFLYILDFLKKTD